MELEEIFNVDFDYIIINNIHYFVKKRNIIHDGSCGDCKEKSTDESMEGCKLNNYYFLNKKTNKRFPYGVYCELMTMYDLIPTKEKKDILLIELSTKYDIATVIKP